MKIKNVFDEIFSMENLYAALEDASSGRRYNRDVLRANMDAWEILHAIRKAVYSGAYQIERYYIFYVYEPKKRMIMSIRFPHRIVQWAIYRVINPILVRGYIRDSYGCIQDRGNLRAMQRLKYWLDQVGRQNRQWYYLKLDISKYFYRINHRILRNILAKKIKDQRLLELLGGIIDCPHTPFGLPPGKGPGDVLLEDRLYDVGMPVGNLLSQMFANLYLDALDQFSKRLLQIRYYVRCMDDIIILGNNKQQLREWKDQISDFLDRELELQLNRKTCIRPVSQGIEFVGYRVWADRVTLRKKTTLHIKRALCMKREAYLSGEITLAQARDALCAYLGMMKHCDCGAFRNRLLEDFVLTHAEKWVRDPERGNADESNNCRDAGNTERDHKTTV